MNRLLITGASGFLGSRAAVYFKDKCEVFTPTHREMDITDVASVEAAFEKIKPDVVFHCAAISDTGRCEKEPEFSWQINVNGSVNVARAAKAVGAKCVLCSSDQVYFGSQLKGAHREDEMLEPFNLYGREKLAAEQECLKANPDCVCLRLSWMYDTKIVNVGEHSDFLRTFVSKVEQDETLSYAIYDIRGITDVNEVVSNMEKSFGLPGGVYNFGSPNARNMYDTMAAVFTKLGLDMAKLQKNEEAFRNNPRNMNMCQAKVNARGVHFTPTKEHLVRNIGMVLKGMEGNA